GIHSWQMLAPLAVAGFGFGLIAAALVDLILTGVPVRDAGSGSGVLSTTQQVGMALGYALVGVIFFSLLASGSGHGGTAVTAASPAPRHAPTRRRLRARAAARAGPPPPRGAPRQLPAPPGRGRPARRAAAGTAGTADRRGQASQRAQLRPHFQRHHVARGRRP